MLQIPRTGKVDVDGVEFLLAVEVENPVLGIPLAEAVERKVDDDDVTCVGTAGPTGGTKGMLVQNHGQNPTFL